MSLSVFSSLDGCKDDDDVVSPSAGEKDIYVQLVISLALGVSSFIAFCVGFETLLTPVRLNLLIIIAVITSPMERPLCCPKTPNRCCCDSA